MTTTPVTEPELYSLEAEQALLGAILFGGAEVHERVADMVQAADFSQAAHGAIYESADFLATNGKTVSPVTVWELIKSDVPESERPTAQRYLTVCTQSVPSTVAAPDYAEVVRDYAQKRRFMQTVTGFMSQAESPDVTCTQLLADLNDQLLDIETGGCSASSGSLKEIAAEWDEEKEAGTMEAGMPTHFPALDELFSGFRPGHLVLLAGRPSMGKTAVACSLALEAAKRGTGVGFISMEMERRELYYRLVSSQMRSAGAQLPYRDIIQNDVPPTVDGSLASAKSALSKLPMRIDDTRGVDGRGVALRARQVARRLAAAGAVMKLLFVDYLQIIRPVGGRWNNKSTEIGDICRDLRALAKSLQCTVVLLSQLNRRVEERDPPVPMMPDLRDSGEIEESADSVVFLYRPEYYLERTRPGKDSTDYHEWETNYEAVRNRSQLIIAKQRSGPIGTVTLDCEVKFNFIRSEQQEALL